MTNFTDFRIKRGSAKSFYVNGSINPLLVIEEGCWYLCTDTAELFLGVLDEGGNPVLKRINDTDGSYENYIKTITALNSEINAIKENLTSYAKKTDIPDVSGLVTKETLDAAIEAIEKTDIDLTDYATKQYVVDTVANQIQTEDLAKKDEVEDVKTKLETEVIPTIEELVDKAATQEWVQEQGYLTQHQDISHLATKEDLPDVSAFITSIPDEYITEEDLDAKGYLTEHQSLEGLATESFVTEKITEAQLSGGVDLSGYATKEDLDDLASIEYVDKKLEAVETPDIPTRLSELENDMLFVTADTVDTSINEQLPEAVTQIIETVVLHGGDATP